MKVSLSIQSKLFFAGGRSNYPLMEIVKKGGCGIEMTDWIAKVERKYQIAGQKSNFHLISFKGYLDALPKDYYSYEHSYWNWITMKHNPYIPVFEEKILQADEIGLSHKFWDEVVPFKVDHNEPLEALKLEHFYIMLIGIAIGLALSLMAFAAERLVLPKTNGTPPPPGPENVAK